MNHHSIYNVTLRVSAPSAFAIWIRPKHKAWRDTIYVIKCKLQLQDGRQDHSNIAINTNSTKQATTNFGVCLSTAHALNGSLNLPHKLAHTHTLTPTCRPTRQLKPLTRCSLESVAGTASMRPPPCPLGTPSQTHPQHAKTLRRHLFCQAEQRRVRSLRTALSSRHRSSETQPRVTWCRRVVVTEIESSWHMCKIVVIYTFHCFTL